MNKESKMWAEEKLRDILRRLALNADEGYNEKFDWFEWGIIYDIVKVYATKHGINTNVGGPVSHVGGGGEQLGNEGSAKSVRGDECDHNVIEGPHGYYCSKCNRLV
jgi:hypothetical protein